MNLFEKKNYISLEKPETRRPERRMKSKEPSIPDGMWIKCNSCKNIIYKKEVTKYEIEYLIAGKDSEKENLGAVFWKMIALRFLTNAACVYQDPVKEKEATLLAASVLGITGFPPVVVVPK